MPKMQVNQLVDRGLLLLMHDQKKQTFLTNRDISCSGCLYSLCGPYHGGRGRGPSGEGFPFASYGKLPAQVKVVLALALCHFGIF